MTLKKSQCLNLNKVAKTLNNLKDPYIVPKEKDQGDGKFHALFGNITSCGPKAEPFIFSDSVFGKYDALMFVETHLRDQKLINLQDKLSNSSWASNN